MPFVFLIFRNYTTGRIARSSKIEGLKGIMGCPKEEGVSPIKGNGSPAEGETRENKMGKKLSLGIPLSFLSLLLLRRFFLMFSLSPRYRISSASSPSECSLRFRI